MVAAAVAIVLLAVGLLLGSSIVRSGGHLVYTFDDAYIHLALADNLSQGHYGVHSTESSSPSSSILWPLLLVPFRWLGLDALGPLLLNIASAVGLVVLVARTVVPLFGDLKRLSTQALALGLVLGVVVSTHVVALVFTGLEHPLQLLLVAAIVAGLGRPARPSRALFDSLEPVASHPSLTGRGSGSFDALTPDGASKDPSLPLARGTGLPWWAWVALITAPLVRYEALAVSLPALIVVGARGQIRRSLGAGAVLLALIGGFSVLLVTHGLLPLPASVTAKSTAPWLVQAPSLWLEGLARRAMSSEGVRLGIAALLLGVLCWVARRRSIERQVAGVAAAAACAQLVVGDLDWYGRYGAYAWTCCLLAFLIAARAPLTAVLSRVPALGTLGLCVVLGAASWRVVPNLLKVPLASNNIHEQQYQMHRFVTEYLRAPVAVNDLGWVSYHNPHYVLDLWGLASPEALTARRAGDTAALLDLARRRGVKAALLYAHWFPAFPSAFEPVAVLRRSKPTITAGGDEVTVYAIGSDARPLVTRALDAFAPTLPSGVTLERIAELQAPRQAGLQSLPRTQPR